MGMKSTGEEIVQVQGGHIVRSIGRKDRHSKVYTAKGPRERRVRLSAHTAIQFYDVQDRLGYDRPSKAVDWLIKKAKSSIDKLAELPPWQPTTGTIAAPDANPNEGSSEMAIAEESESPGYNFQLQRQLGENPDNHSGFIPPPIDTDCSIADTLKSFFPTSSATSSINFQSYSPDIIPRTTNPSEDLGLSLHSFQDPGLIHGQSQGDTNQTPPNHQTHFAGPTPIGFETNYQRIVPWNSESSTEINRGGFIFNSHPYLGPNSAFSQRGTLQSSFAPSVHQSSIFGSCFLSDGLHGFSIPARIQGEEEDHVVASNRPSSASPNSHH